MIKKIRNKVTEKEAIQWTGRNLEEVSQFVGDALQPIARRMDYDLKIATIEGVMKVDKGAWIVKGLNGEFYPCKPDIFEKSYEIID